MKTKKQLFGKPNQQVTDRRTDLQFHCLTEGDSYDLYKYAWKMTGPPAKITTSG